MERTLKFNINSDKINSGLKAVNAGLKKTQRVGMTAAKLVGNAFKRLTSKLFSFKGAIVGIAGPAAMGLLIKSSLDAIDKIGKLHTQTGLATETLGTLKLAAEIAGTSLDATTKAAVKLGKNVYDYVVLNLGEARDAFDGLGVSQSDLTPIMNDTEAQLRLVADKFSQMEDGSTKSTLALKLFGRAGLELIPLLNEGAAGFHKMYAEAKRFGLVMSEATVRGVEAANDSFVRLKSRMTGVLHQTVAALAPGMEAAFVQIGDVIDVYIEKHGGIEKVAMTVAIAVLDTIKNMITGYGDFVNAITGTINAILRAADKLGAIDLIDPQKIDSINAKLQTSGERLASLINEGRKPWDKQIIQTKSAMARLVTELNEANKGISLLGSGVDTSDAEAKIENLKTKIASLSKEGGDAGGDVDAPPLGKQADTTPTQFLDDEYFLGLKAKTDALQTALLTEEQQLRLTYQNRQILLEDANIMGDISDAEHKALVLITTNDFEASKTAITKKGETDRLNMMASNIGNVGSMMGSLSQLTAKEGEKMSSKQKILAKASIIASTAAGIMKSHSQVPWPGNWAEAGAIALQGAVQLKAVGKGGSVSGGATSAVNGAPSLAATPIATPTQVEQRGEAVIQLHGNFYGWDDQVIDELVEGIAAAVDDRDVRLISPTSRNAEDLQSAVV